MRGVDFCVSDFVRMTGYSIARGIQVFKPLVLWIDCLVVYKKIMFSYFHSVSQTLYRSLVELLEYEGEDMEDVFMQTFRVGYQDVFGTSLTHDLKADGGNIFVNQSSKHEFVELYADFLLNKMVERQFRAFRRGFKWFQRLSPLNLF
ncbi:ubiquitin-protein ligase E3A-like [Penaeus monodon]|uniref:ubiquitin-protein ligase E3A-like n=1 Tax=Penaeus monodon TaxID=6687 RepID=UPI0018A7AC6C|nr:ubiquitin-protein ligase E3A-like [Penaeus monodon]